MPAPSPGLQMLVTDMVASYLVTRRYTGLPVVHADGQALALLTMQQAR
jgi:hypothetical protein